MVKTRQWQLVHKPRDEAKLDGPDQTFKLAEVDLSDPKEGQLLVKLLSLSNDPAQRIWIEADTDPERLYIPPVNIGEPMRARGLAEVVESRSNKYQKGDTVITQINWSEYAVVDAKACQPAEDLPGDRTKTHYLGTFGLTGLTAYFGITEIGKAKPEDVVIVSGAAGATGSMVVQIAKKIIGCKKVIGIAGSDEKCRWVEETLGADLCLNYKNKSHLVEEIQKATPGPDGFANVYFDNVGGEILDLILSRMALHGRVVACGSISSYNTADERTTGLKNWTNLIFMRLTCQGFIITDFTEQFPQALDVLRKALADGKLNIDKSETLITTDFEGIPSTWMKLFDGSNQGKLVTQMSS